VDFARCGAGRARRRVEEERLAQGALSLRIVIDESAVHSCAPPRRSAPAASLRQVKQQAACQAGTNETTYYFRIRTKSASRMTQSDGDLAKRDSRARHAPSLEDE